MIRLAVSPPRTLTQRSPQGIQPSNGSKVLISLGTQPSSPTNILGLHTERGYKQRTNQISTNTLALLIPFFWLSNASQAGQQARDDAQGPLGFVFPAHIPSIRSTTTTPPPPYSPMSTTPPAVPSSSPSDEHPQPGKPNGVPESLSSLSAMNYGVSDNFEWKQGETQLSYVGLP